MLSNGLFALFQCFDVYLRKLSLFHCFIINFYIVFIVCLAQDWRIHGDDQAARVSVFLQRRCCLTSVFGLLYFPHYKYIAVLDISGCISLDATSVIDLCDSFNNLEVFMYRDHTNVSQYNLQCIVDLSPKIRYIDGINAATVSTTIALGITATASKLQKLWVEPNPLDTLIWPKIVFRYACINFGPSVSDILPCPCTPAGIRKLIATEF